MLEQAIIEQASDAIIFANPQGTIERWNAAASALFGFDVDEALGQSLDLIIPEPLREAHWRGWNKAMAQRTLRLNGKPTLTRGLHKSGNKLYVEMSFALVVGANDEPLGSVAIARDVTERIEKERAARQATSAARS